MKYDVCLYADDREAVKVRKLLCDRCGSEIDISFMGKYDMHGSSICRILGKNAEFDAATSGDLEYDLCEDCTNKLVEFLKN